MIQGGDGQFGKKASLNTGRVGHRRTGLQVRRRAVQGRLLSAAPWRWRTRARTPTARSSSSARGLTALPKNYTIFGQVTKGLDVVDAIATRAAQLARPAGRPGRDDLRHHRGRGLAAPPRPTRSSQAGAARLQSVSVKAFSPNRTRNPFPNPHQIARICDRCQSASAAPASGSWVGWVRVVGSADAIDDPGAWQKVRSEGGHLHRDSNRGGPPGPPRTFKRTRCGA